MAKCDGCLDRVIPRRVTVCPNGALAAKEEEAADDIADSPAREPVLV